MNRSFFHTGDIGDIIAALPTIRKIGGGELIIGYRQNGQRESLRGARFEALVPLLLAQPYISGARWGSPNPGCLDFSRFRETPDDGMNLAFHQSAYAGVDEISMEPWLTARAIPHGRPVIARSARYHNPDFPWRDVLKKLPNPIFVGLPQEHAAFCSFVGTNVEHVRCANLLQLARTIAGGSVFVGNQSAPFWIAAALGGRCIQESWAEGPNSTIHRKGMFYPMRMDYDIDACLR